MSLIMCGDISVQLNRCQRRKGLSGIQINMHVTSTTDLVSMPYFGWQTLSTRDPQSTCKVNLFGGLTGYYLFL